MKAKNKIFLVLLFSLSLSSPGFSASDATQQVEQAPHQQGELIWADLYSGDVDASIEFYINTFGWTVKKFGKSSSSYHILYDGSQPIAGVLARNSQRGDSESALWIGNIATENIQTTIRKAEENNASIILQPHDFALYGERAVFSDPQGGIIALLTIDEDSRNQQNISDGWNWAQLFSVDPEASSLFYAASLGYTVEQAEQGENSYYLSQHDLTSLSIVKLPESFEQRDHWVNFLNVEGLSDYLERATDNGATVIYAPETNDIAIISDPNGAFIGLSENLPTMESE